MVNCAICKNDTGDTQIESESGVICLSCFSKLEQDPRSKPAEEKKDTNRPVKAVPELCSVCNTPLDQNTIIEGAEDLCLNCFMANAREEDKVTKDMENYNDLTDPGTQNFVIFSLFRDQDESGNKEASQQPNVSVRYLNIEKKNPANIDIYDIHSPITELPPAVPDYFASVVPLSPYQFLVTGGAKWSPSGPTALSQCLAVVVNKYSRYFCFGPLKTLLYRRFAHSSVILDNYLYVLGGNDKNLTDNAFTWLANCERFKLEGLKADLDTILYEGDRSSLSKTNWEEVAKMSKPRSNFNTFAHEGKIYAFGGFSGPNQLESSIERYDPATNKWEVLDFQDKLKKINYKFLASSLLLKVKDHIYIIGGSDGKAPSNQVVKLNPKTLEFEACKPLNNPRAGAQGFVAEKTLYIFGGQTSPLVLETLDLENSGAGFKVHKPSDETDKDSGLLDRGFIGNFGFFIQ